MILHFYIAFSYRVMNKISFLNHVLVYFADNQESKGKTGIKA